MTSKKMTLFILTLPRKIKRIIVMIIDSSLSLFAVWIAYYLRIGEFLILWKKYDEYYALPACIAAIFISILIFTIFRLYKTIFRYSGGQAMITTGKAFIVYAIIYSTIFTIIGINGVPRTIGILQPLILFILISISRFIAVYWLGGVYLNQLNINKKPKTLIYGAGNAGRQLASNLLQNAKANIIGFLDDNSALHNNTINGLYVFNPNKIDKLINKKNVSEIIFALPLNSGHRIKEILNQFRGKNLVLRTLSKDKNQIQSQINSDIVRNLLIEDILGRDPVKPDPNLMQRDITNKIVLVTGAGGSIGSALCHQIYSQKPKKIVLLDHNEFGIYNIAEQLRNKSTPDKHNVDIIPRIGSITDKILIENLLNEQQPDTIFHAAAYKHVSIVENNKLEGLKNNVFGTLVLVNATIAAKINKFVLISSDKAVRPTNVMGASKRLAEMILQALSVSQNKTIFAIVRFGNVLNSSGSVVPIFKSQIKSGGPITVTHPDMKRYFMTIEEAAALVIQAGAMSEKPKELGLPLRVYILDMGNPIKIYDLAKLMISLSGLTVFDEITQKGDIQIKFIGKKPGEKLCEELYIDNCIGYTDHAKIKYITEKFIPWKILKGELLDIMEAINISNEKLVLRTIQKLVTGFKIKK